MADVVREHRRAESGGQRDSAVIAAQVGFVVVGCASRAVDNEPVASTKPMMRVARRERRDNESTIRIGFMLLRRVLFNRPCDRRSLISGFLRLPRISSPSSIRDVPAAVRLPARRPVAALQLAADRDRRLVFAAVAATRRLVRANRCDGARMPVVGILSNAPSLSMVPTTTPRRRLRGSFLFGKNATRPGRRP